MDRSLVFWKFNGCGNDFILVDDRNGKFPLSSREWIAHLCHRRKGIGADGVILLIKSGKADLRMRIFNADGSEAEMCGNGIRCLAKLARHLGWQKKTLMIETMHRIYPITWEGEEIRVDLGPPIEERRRISLELFGHPLEVHFLNTGVPHAVIFLNNSAEWHQFDVALWGKGLREHSHFAPAGTNVNFAWVDPTRQIWLRTYERGVEAETWACGTGATAAALAAAQLYLLPSPIHVNLYSGDVLHISFSPSFDKVSMTGGATLVYEGTISEDSNP